MKEYLEMKEYFQESVLSTISTSCSKMENARCISLRILLYIRERWILILSVPSRERSTRTRTLARNSFGIVTNTNSLLSQHTRRIHDTAIMIQVVLGTPYGSTEFYLDMEEPALTPCGKLTSLIY